MSLAIVGAPDAANFQVVDVRDPSHPAPLCTLPNVGASLQSRFQFASATEVSYIRFSSERPTGIVRRNLRSTVERVVVDLTGVHGEGIHAWSPDGSRLVYLRSDPIELHLLQAGADQILTRLGPVPGRGWGWDDQLYLSFSPDGTQFALVETFTEVRSADLSDARFQVRSADGRSLTAFATGRTMAVWVAPDKLYFRDDSGIRAWTSTGVVTVAAGVKWTEPSRSPDGRYVEYSVRNTAGVPRPSVLDLQTGTAFQPTAAIRAQAAFLSPTVLWYREETSCSGCGLSPTRPTGRAFLYDIATRTESASMISDLQAIWPR
jgi:hypothetical protein